MLACKKSNPDVFRSPLAVIDVFSFKVGDNQGVLSQTVNGEIRNDTIVIKVPQGTPLATLKPWISFRGSSLSPQSGQANDFSRTTLYTVTAEDGSQKMYKVLVNYFSDAKEITSFSFKASDNPGLGEDVFGTVTRDTITLSLPPSADLSTLRPTITYTGKELSPSADDRQNFVSPVVYTVKAEDGSTRKYTVFSTANSVVFFGDEKGVIYAVEALTGKLKWQYNTNASLSLNSLAYNNGAVYVANHAGHLYAFDTSTGTVKWESYADQPFFGPPAFLNNMLYIASAASSTYLLAYDALTGQQRWKIEGAPFSVGAEVGANLVFYNTNKGLSAIDAQTGVVQWTYDVGLMRERPTLINNTLFGGGEKSRLFALEASSGKERWTLSEPAGGLSAPEVKGDTVYVGTGNAISAYSALNGTHYWDFFSDGSTCGNCGNGLFSAPVYYNGVLYAGNDDTHVYAIDARTGRLKWKLGEGIQLGGFRTNATVGNGVVYIGSAEGYLYALDSKTGSVVWKHKAAGAVYAGACVVDTKNSVYHAGNSANH